MANKVSRSRIRHFFHLVSNVRPVVWICLYVTFVPVFAVIYHLLPDGQFRYPDGAGTGFGSWLYYSIVTITTLGFGDYTPAHGWAQAVTAIEVMCGMLTLGFFLNAVGSMKSEIDVESELEKQRRVRETLQKEMLVKNIPVIMHKLNMFLAYCRAVTTPVDRRTDAGIYDGNFSFRDMRDLYAPSGLPADRSGRPAVEGLLQCAANTSLFLDQLQGRVDLSLWPDILENCFGFVADYQLFSSAEALREWPRMRMDRTAGLPAEKARLEIAEDIASWEGPVEEAARGEMAPAVELYYFIRHAGQTALDLEASLTAMAAVRNPQ